MSFPCACCNQDRPTDPEVNLLEFSGSRAPSTRQKVTVRRERKAGYKRRISGFLRFDFGPHDWLGSFSHDETTSVATRLQQLA